MAVPFVPPSGGARGGAGMSHGRLHWCAVLIARPKNRVSFRVAADLRAAKDRSKVPACRNHSRNLVIVQSTPKRGPLTAWQRKAEAQCIGRQATFAGRGCSCPHFVLTVRCWPRLDPSRRSKHDARRTRRQSPSCMKMLWLRVAGASLNEPQLQVRSWLRKGKSR